MDEKNFVVVIHVTDKAALKGAVESLQNLNLPPNFNVEIMTFQGNSKYHAYNYAMKNSKAKYKIYMDEQIVIHNKNILVDILKIFEQDKSIGMIGCSGAIQLSTHGVCINSSKRCGKIRLGNFGESLKDWGNIVGDYCEVEALDGCFMATQYDIPFDEELEYFSDAAQCIEFRRKNYKVVIPNQQNAWLCCRYSAWRIREIDKRNFLEKYSKYIFPLVSVIIPTFNRPKYFQEALESALNQTYRNFEIVVSDDSTDNETEKLIQPYLEKYPCIKYFRNKGFTAHDNWNFLRKYNNPDAEYVNWLMDDDLFYPTKIEKMVEIYRNNPDVSLVTSSRNFIDADGKIISSTKDFSSRDLKLNGDEAGRLLFQLDNYIGEPTTVLIRKKFLRDNDLCWSAEHKGFFCLVDVSTWCQLLSQGNLFRYGEELCAFRRHEGQGQNWIYGGPLFAISFIKFFKMALDKKVFFHSENEIREAIFFLLQYSLSHLRRAQMYNYHGEEVKSLEKYFAMLARSLNNGYKIELPKVTYSSQDKFNQIGGGN